MTVRLAIVALSLLAAADDDPFAGRVTGPVASCIDARLTPEVQIPDPHTIIYRETAKRLWRTGPDGPCPDLEPLATLVVEQQGAELCRGDRFRVRREGSGTRGGICRFTGFTPYDKP